MKAGEIKQLLIDKFNCKHFTARGSYLNCTCPLHRESNPSFGVNVKEVGHPWNCFKCGGGMSLISLVTVGLSVSKYDAEKIIRSYGDFELPDLTNEDISAMLTKSLFTDSSGREDMSMSLELFNKIYKSSLNRPYHVFNHSVTVKNCIKYDIESNRYVIPFIKHDKVYGIVSVSPRGEKNTAKLIPVGEFSHKENIYYPYGQKISQVNKLFICESISDSIALKTAGYDAIAVNGVTLSDKQIAEIRKEIMPNIIVCCGDGDVAGNKLNLRIREEFKEFMLFKLTLPDQKDICDLSKEELMECIDKMLFFSL